MLPRLLVGLIFCSVCSLVCISLHCVLYILSMLQCGNTSKLCMCLRAHARNSEGFLEDDLARKHILYRHGYQSC